MSLIRSLKLTILALVALIVLGASSAAAATNEIEGVWSFERGTVAIHPQPNDTFTGIVESETQFGECPHLPGEEMWTDITQQPDGSFWGFHKWFVDKSGACEPDPNGQGLGPTAWRVLQNSNGARFLKVCFSHPGTSQPKIAPDGTETETTYGCYNSALVEPLRSSAGGSNSPPNVPNTVGLPDSNACISQTSLEIMLKNHKDDPFKQILVRINGKKVVQIKGIKTLAKILKKGIALTKLPSGTYTVSVLATTILKQRLTGSHTYKSCTTGSGKIKLKSSKKHHHT